MGLLLPPDRLHARAEFDTAVPVVPPFLRLRQVRRTAPSRSAAVSALWIWLDAVPLWGSIRLLMAHRRAQAAVDQPLEAALAQRQASDRLAPEAAVPPRRDLPAKVRAKAHSPPPQSRLTKIGRASCRESGQ